VYKKVIAAQKKPNFFILGAAKCGTTSLHYYLHQHPEIYLSQVKEPCFFCEEFQVVKSEEEYLKLFEGVTAEKAIGEASHVYFTSPGTPKLLHRLFPRARFILIFRHPADRAYSLYHHMKRFGFETAETFERALELEEERVKSASFKDNCPQYLYNFLYFHSGLYGEQIERYFSLFTRDRFHFLTLRRLHQEPETVLRGIFRFLNVSDHFSPRLEEKNRGMTARFSLIEKLLSNAKLVDFLSTNTMLKRIALGPVKNLFFSDIPPLSPETRRHLVSMYANDLALFQKRTGLDLNE
jgi:hypothetical protein